MLITMNNVMLITMNNVMLITTNNVMLITMNNVMLILMNNVMFITMNNVMLILMKNVMFITMKNVKTLSLYWLLVVSSNISISIYKCGQKVLDLSLSVLLNLIHGLPIHKFWPRKGLYLPCVRPDDCSKAAECCNENWE